MSVPILRISLLSMWVCACGGTARTLEVIPEAVDFPGTAPLTTMTTPVVLANQASSDLTLTPGPITGPQATLFSIDQSTPFTVASATSASINVTYAPLVSSTGDNALFIISMSSGGSVTIPLHGVAP